jgi:predicted transcriptional regulator
MDLSIFPDLLKKSFKTFAILKICSIFVEYILNYRDMQLTSAEEQVMKYIWKLERAYMKNILDEFPEPKPATTTVATLLKRMTIKGFIAFDQHGSNRLYFPLVEKTEYFSSHIKSIISNYFNNSASQFASFFTTETNMNEKELKELRDMVDDQIKNNTRKK